MVLLVLIHGLNYLVYKRHITMEEKDRNKLERLEYLAHIHAFTQLGTFYYENFLINEEYYNAKYCKYKRRW